MDKLAMIYTMLHRKQQMYNTNPTTTTLYGIYIYCTERLFQCLMSNQYDDFTKSLGQTKIVSFSKVFNSLSFCFVYLVLFYKPFQTFIIDFTCIVSLYRNDPTPVRLIVDWFFRRGIYIYIILQCIYIYILFVQMIIHLWLSFLF